MTTRKKNFLVQCIIMLIFVTQSYAFIHAVTFFGIDFIFAKYVGHLNYYILDFIACFIAFVFFCLAFLSMARHPKPIYALSHNKTDFALMTFISTIITVGMGGIATLWMNFAYHYLSEVPLIQESIESFSDTWSDVDTSPYLFVFLSVVLFGPIVEELMFRAIAMRYFKKRLPFPIPIILSALAFGIWHEEPVQVVYTFLLGLMIGIVFEYTENLFFPIYMHILNNFLSTLPNAWSTDEVYNVIYGLNAILVLPSIILCLYLCVQIQNRYRMRLQETPH